MAKWIYDHSGNKTLCSNCGKGKWKGYVPAIEEATEWMPYCPQCGVKMEAVKEPVDRGYLIDWYINSVSEDDAPVWTEDHIDELVADFNLYPRK